MRRLVRLAAPVAALMIVSALVSPPAAPANGAPGSLTSTVEWTVRQFGGSRLESAWYVETSANGAARVLGKKRGELYPSTPKSVYLVVLEGDFSVDTVGVKGRAPYLAFLYFPEGETWESTDFTLLRRPVALESAGTPREVKSFLLAHSTLLSVYAEVLVGLVLVGPPVLLAVSAALCGWKRRSVWPFIFGTCAALAVAAWQTFATVFSLWGCPLDATFLVMKVGTLAVVLAVELSTVYALLKARPRERRADETGVPEQSYPVAGLALLITAAALYVPTYYVLATTGE